MHKPEKACDWFLAEAASAAVLGIIGIIVFTSQGHVGFQPYVLTGGVVAASWIIRAAVYDTRPPVLWIDRWMLGALSRVFLFFIRKGRGD